MLLQSQAKYMLDLLYIYHILLFYTIIYIIVYILQIYQLYNTYKNIGNEYTNLSYISEDIFLCIFIYIMIADVAYMLPLAL